MVEEQKGTAMRRKLLYNKTPQRSIGPRGQV